MTERTSKGAILFEADYPSLTQLETTQNRIIKLGLAAATIGAAEGVRRDSIIPPRLGTWAAMACVASALYIDKKLDQNQ
jgi:acyl transferase domain-containing protein